MKPSLDIGPTLDTGTLRATATFQDPDVRLPASAPDDCPRLRIEEGSVLVELEFPDLGAVRRFLRRLRFLQLPRGDRQ